MTDLVTLLLIDDEPNNIRALVLDLENTGYQVMTAKDGAEGWSVLQKNKDTINAILLDRMMPVMDGMEFLRKMKTESDVPDIPVIMQTAAAEKEQVAEGIRAGVYYYLTKPYYKLVMQSIVMAAVADYAKYNKLRSEVKKIVRNLSLIKEARLEIRTLEDVSSLSTVVANFFPDPERVVLGISELLTNAVEHGNLCIGYDEKTELNNSGTWEQEVKRRLAMPENVHKKVNITFQRTEHFITLTIKDEGDGFDWREYIDISPERATHNHGRGIAIAKMTSFDRVEYVGNGNEVACWVSCLNEDGMNK